MLVYSHTQEALECRCPALHYGIKCAEATQYSIKQAIRIPLWVDQGSSLWLPFESPPAHRFRRRSALERIDGRLDHRFGGELHTTRLRNNMRMSPACSAMLVIAASQA